MNAGYGAPGRGTASGSDLAADRGGCPFEGGGQEAGTRTRPIQAQSSARQTQIDRATVPAGESMRRLAAAGGRREGRDRFDGRRSGPEALAIEGDRWQRSVGAGRRAGAARTAGPSLRLALVVWCAWEARGVDAPPSDGGLPASERDRRDMTPSNQWCIVPRVGDTARSVGAQGGRKITVTVTVTRVCYTPLTLF